jgi:hypothetical protein
MIHKLTIKSYFSKNPLLDTPLFYKTMLQEWFEIFAFFK